jgi:hypothetical protein
MTRNANRTRKILSGVRDWLKTSAGQLGQIRDPQNGLDQIGTVGSSLARFVIPSSHVAG